MRRITAIVVLLVAVSALAASANLPRQRWEFAEEHGVLWMTRLGDPPLASDGEICPDLPKLEYIRERTLDEHSDNDETTLGQLVWRGRWSVRPLHVWGVYSDVGCKEPLGWGTVFLVGLYKRTYIWITVEHNVVTQKYFQSIAGRVIATNWFVQDDDGNFKELFPVGCREDKYCVLISSYVHGTTPLSLDDDLISSEIRLLMPTYLYGCSVQAEAVKRYEHYRLYHFCLASEGFVNSPDSIPYRIGGDFLVSNPAMPGFSGAPVLAYRDGRFFVLGTVNAGVEGVFTAVNAIGANTIAAVKEWLQYGEKLFDKPAGY